MEKNDLIENVDMAEEEKNFLDMFKVLWFDLALLCALALVVLLVILCLPKNRLERNLSKAETLYAAGDYKGAAVKYLKAEAASNSSFKAKLGRIYALKACNTENMEEIYIAEAKNALEIGAVKDEEKPMMVEFYLLAPEYITKDLDTLIEILESAYEKYQINDFRNPIADAYYHLGLKEGDVDVETALLHFEKALEYSDNADAYAKSISDEIDTYINTLKNLDEFEKAYAVCEKYKNLEFFDYETAKNTVEKTEALFNRKAVLMDDVKTRLGWYYDANKPLFSRDYIEGQEGPLFGMMDADFSEMLLLDGSEEADELANSFSQTAYLSKDALNGVGAALFTYGEPYTDENGNICSGYYFYYGEFKDGKKNGYGISIVKTDIASYKAYEGFWENDMPNGFGVYYESNMYAHTSLAEYRSITFGEFKDGAMNGEMTERAVLNEYPDTYFLGSFAATNGDVPAVTGDLMEYGIVDPIPEGTYLVGRLQSVEDGYDYFISIYKREGELFKVEGF